MKKIIVSAFQCLTLIFLLNFTACNKSSDSAPIIFTWTFTGTNYTANFKTVYSTSIGSNKPLIIGGTGTAANQSGIGPRITLTSLNVAAYPFGGNNANIFDYVNDVGDLLQATDGSLIITANSNNHVSGNFSATLIDASNATNTITGEFSNIEIE